MGILDKLLGGDKEKKADDAADKGSKLPGPIGDASRSYKLFRRGEEEVEDRKSD